jgi:hypothetical protein
VDVCKVSRRCPVTGSICILSYNTIQRPPKKTLSRLSLIAGIKRISIAISESRS